MYINFLKLKKKNLSFSTLQSAHLSIHLPAGCGFVGAQMSICGDGFLNMTMEDCDDNNTIPGDGCSMNCAIEFGYTCNYGFDSTLMLNRSMCMPNCSDGIVIWPEECDDNNRMNGDGCGSDCMMEEGFTCNITLIMGFNISVDCGPECGDGRVILPEDCDDNNRMSGDGCSDSCQMEDQFECMSGINGVSLCVTVTLLDLNTFDDTTLNYTNEFFDLNTIVYLSDPNLTNMTSFYLSPFGGVC